MSFGGKAGTMHDWTLMKLKVRMFIKHALDLGYNFLLIQQMDIQAGTSGGEYLGKALKKT